MIGMTMHDQPQPKAWVQKGISPAAMSFHWLMTMLTCGLWSPVLIVALIKGKRRMVPKY
jgi:hypothetical protein